MSVIETATRLQSLGLLWPALLVVVKATLILLIARLLVAALPRASAAAKHLLLSIALCSAIALPMLEVALPAWNIGVFRAPAKASADVKTIGATGDEDDAPPSTVAAAITVAKAAGIVRESRINAVSRAIDRVRNSWQGFVFLAIAAVSVAFLIRIAIGVAGVRAVSRRAREVEDPAELRALDAACDLLRLDRPVRLMRSESVSVPVVWGLFKPVLLLPSASAEWPAERLRVVLLHELAHVKRGDGVTLLVTKIAVALFWFHPLMWTLERAARAECERACDDLVLDSGTKPSDYADHLLAIAKALPQADPFRNVTLAMSRRSQLEGRLLSILQPHVRRAHFSAAAVAVAAVMAFLLVAPFASVRLVAAPQKASTSIDVYAEKESKHSAFDLEKLLDTTDVLVAHYERLTSKHAPESGKEWYEHAYNLHRHRDFEEAIEGFKQSAAHGYRVEDSMYNIACAYAQMHDPENAVKWLREAIAAGYNDYHHIESDDDFEPIRDDASFRQVLAEAPDREHADEDKATATLHQYETLRSIPHAEGEAWFSVGYDLLQVHQFDESIDAFGRAVEKGYKPATSLYNMACGYSRKGDTTQAIDYLEKALNEGFDAPDKFADDSDLDNVRRDPRFKDLKKMATDLRLNALGTTVDTMLNAGEDWSHALPRFRDMTRQYPGTGRSWFNLGYAALQAQQNAESIRAFERALELNYRSPTTMYNLACANARSGRRDAAIEWLEKSRAAGFELGKYIDNDSDLLSLRLDPRFREIRREVRADQR